MMLHHSFGDIYGMGICLRNCPVLTCAKPVRVTAYALSDRCGMRHGNVWRLHVAPPRPGCLITVVFSTVQDPPTSG